MLSRRHLRIKVMQQLYGSFNQSPDNISAGERELMLSIDRFYELFLYQVSFLTELFDTAQKQLEDVKLKHLPTEKEKSDNTLFIKNRFLIELSETEALKNHYTKKNISWIGENEIVRKALSNFKNGREFEAYVATEENDFDKDKALILKMIKKYINDFPPLMQFYEEKSIFWVDDIDIVNLILTQIIKSCKEGEVDKIFTALEWDIKEEDLEFAKNLFKKTCINSGRYEKIISDKTIKWEVERIALIDILLMKMAICELLEFPSIPLKATLNEYIELAKMYSTPKSSSFINGILDKLIGDFKNEKIIKKTGRGLM